MMPPCEHCIHYTDCGYYWKSDDDWLDCDDYEFNRFTFREYNNDE